MKQSKLIALLLKFFGVNTDVVDVGKELKQLKSIRERLELAKKQQGETIAESEVNKLDNDVELQEALREIEAEYAAKNKDEDSKIEAAESIIKEADEWLGMFPTK